MLVLVIGAAGKTGLAVTRALASRGVAVRAGLHSTRNAQAAYAAGAASIAVFDLVTGSGLPAALHGVEAVYHLAPNVHPGEVDIARKVADAAVGAGVARFAFHSVLRPDDAAMPHHLRKAEAEGVIRARLPRGTILRPAAYHQNLLEAALAGRITVPYSLDAPFTNVDLNDVAEVAATVLTQKGHAGMTYDLCGPEVLSVREQATITGMVLGREVAAIELPIPDWLRGAGAGLEPSARRDLEAMFRSYDRYGFVGDSEALEHLLDRRPTTWRQALERTIARAQPS